MARRISTTQTAEEPAGVRAVPADDRDRKIEKVEAVIWFLLSVAVAIIVVRFVLLLLGARTGVPFVDFWYHLSAPFVSPFAGMFGTLDTYNTYTGMRLELESIIAMLIYGLIAYLAVLAVRLLKSNPNERNV